MTSRAPVSPQREPVRGPEPGPPSRPWFQPQTFAALRHRGYLFIWIGTVITSAGVWMEQVALGWLIYEMTDSPLLLGALTGMRSLPFLFFGPLGGVIADRLDRRFLMLASHYAILALYLWLVLLLALNLLEVWHLFAFTAGSTVAWSFNQPVRQSLVPQLVPRSEIMNAVALQSFGFNLTRIAGPAIGGLLMALVGGTTTFVVVTITWAAVIAITYQIPVPPRLVREREQSLWEDLLEGLRYIKGDPVVLGLLLLGLVPLVFGMSYMSLMPVFARDVFGMDARGLGELMSATGFGAVISALIVASLGNYQGKGMLLLGSTVLLGVGLILFALSGNYLLSLGLLAVVGMFSMAASVLTNSMLQMATPQQYMGRVMSIYMLDRGLMPLGSFGAGAAAELVSAPFAIGLMGAFCIGLIGLGGLFMPHIRRLG